MDGDAFVLKLSPADYAREVAGLAEEIARRVYRASLRLTLVENAWTNDRGVVIEDAAGRLAWDNRLLARLERLWPELRRQIAVRGELVAGRAAVGGAS